MCVCVCVGGRGSYCSCTCTLYIILHVFIFRRVTRHACVLTSLQKKHLSYHLRMYLLHTHKLKKNQRRTIQQGQRESKVAKVKKNGRDPRDRGGWAFLDFTHAH